MQAYVDGDASAFTVLYRRLAKPMRKYVASLAGPDDVDDVVQRAFERVHRFRETYRQPPEGGDRAVVNWVFSVVRNEARNVLRTRVRADSQARRWSTRTVCGDLAHDPQQQIIEAELDALRRRAVRRAIKTLPPAQREVLELGTLRGMGLAQISERLGVRRGTVRVRACRARRALTDQLRDSTAPR